MWEMSVDMVVSLAKCAHSSFSVDLSGQCFIILQADSESNA